MSEAQSDVAIDIGEGRGEYFVQRARENRDKTFVILEPRRLRLMRKPKNLHIINWRDDVDQGLPLKSESVNEANINFLWGELRYNGEEDDEIAHNNAEDRYRKLLKDLKPTLKQGSKLTIIDAKGNLASIKRLLLEEGYSVLEPVPLQDQDRTSWSKEHTDVFNQSPSEGTDFQPTMIEATPLP